jgi:hypothetical protein
MRVSITYTCKWRYNNYVWTTCGICINTKTSKIIKKVSKSGCIGYVLNSKFISLTALKPKLQKLKQFKTPF